MGRGIPVDVMDDAQLSENLRVEIILTGTAGPILANICL